MLDSIDGKSDDLDEDYTPPKVRKVCYNTLAFPSLSEVADRYHVSDTVAASLANAAMKDLKVITKENKTAVIDRYKMRRQRLFHGRKASEAYRQPLGTVQVCTLTESEMIH